MEKKREKSFCFSGSILRGKRLLLMLLMLSVIHVSSIAAPQPALLRVDLKQTSLIEIFNTIKKQSDYTFLYSVEDVENINNISISNKAGDIETILDESLKGTNLEYKIKDSVIIIKPASNTPINNTNTVQEDKKISGVVTDEQGETLPGVSVVIKGTSTGVSTDINGKYQIEVPAKGAILVFSFVYKGFGVLLIFNSSIGIRIAFKLINNLISFNYEAF